MQSKNLKIFEIFLFFFFFNLFVMPKEHLQSAKVVLILCSCFFAYGVSCAYFILFKVVNPLYIRHVGLIGLSITTSFGPIYLSILVPLLRLQ